MKNNIPYDELERHFVAPISISPFYRVNRIPRKLKKELKKNYPLVWNAASLDMGQKLWYRLNMVNPNYVRFLIKKICE